MKNKKRNGMLLLLLLLVGFLAVGYAALSTTLNITGNSNVGGSTWDVHFENLNVTSGSVDATEPTLGKETISYTVDLTTPGDFYEFTVDVVNKGTIDAKVGSEPTLAGVSTDQEKFVNYTVTYENGDDIRVNDSLAKTTGKSTLKVRVEFDKDVENTDLPTTSQSLTLTFMMNYIQK